jgi:hypothetical protein
VSTTLLRSAAANASCLNALKRGDWSTINGDTGYGAVTTGFADIFAVTVVLQRANKSMPADADENDHVVIGDDDDDNDDDDDEEDVAS